jgi:hypothetical protein
MSHIAKIDTKIKDLVYLKKALKTLAIQFAEAQEGETLTLRGYGKNEVINDCIMEIKTGSQYSIGIRQKGKRYEVVADWWAIETFTGQKQEDILNKLTRQYAYETIMDKIKGMGYSVIQEEQDAKENLRISVRRWD